MIVVADSSPLHYLILVEQTDLLRHLYGEVVIPDVVVSELLAAGAPQSVREWISAPPAWLTVIPISDDDLASVTSQLDSGERAAIALAERLRADLLLIDDAIGRSEAMRRSFQVTGTLGVIRAAAELGLIAVPSALERLRATNFYIDEKLLARLFKSWMP